MSDAESQPNIMDVDLSNRTVSSVQIMSSPRLAEVLACLGFLVLCLTVPLAIPLNERSLGSQQLTDGEIVWNLVFREPMHPNTVSTAFVILLGGVLPLGLQISLEFAFSRQVQSPKAALYATLCTYFVALGITSFATGVVKNYCGYLRPSFYELCEAREDGTCTHNDAHKSFPSGHASFSFCGLALLSLFLNQRFGVNSCSSSILSARHRLASITALVFPMGLALFISASRVADNRHFPADVVGGAALGVGISNYVHGVWFGRVSRE